MHAQMCLFKGNLPAENAPVQSVARGEMRKNMIAKSLVYAQMCPFKGNLPPESAPVQSVASGERNKKYACY